jgi:hypothetical protein
LLILELSKIESYNESFKDVLKVAEISHLRGEKDFILIDITDAAEHCEGIFCAFKFIKVEI